MNGKSPPIVGTLVIMMDTFAARIERLRRQVDELRGVVKDAQVQATQALAALGVKPPAPEPETIDVTPPDTSLAGRARGALKLVTQGALIVVAFAVLGVALWSLGLFVSASLLAFVIVTRGLGLRVELSPRGATA